MKVLEWLQDAMLAVAIAVVLLLTGCATTDIRVEKVPEPPVVVKPARPDLVGQAPSEQVRGLYDYILRLEAALQEALNGLEVYRQKKGER